MKMKKIPALLRTISLLMFFGLFAGTGCKKEAEALPSCWGTQRIKPLKRLEGVREDFDGNAFLYKEPQTLSWGSPKGRTPVCIDQLNTLKSLNLIDNFDIKDDKGFWIDSTRNYPYKVWGTIYELVDLTNIIAEPHTMLWLEKVEEAR